MDGTDLSCLWKAHVSCERGSHPHVHLLFWSREYRMVRNTAAGRASQASKSAFLLLSQPRSFPLGSSQKRRKRPPQRPFVSLRGIQRCRLIYVLSSTSRLPHSPCALLSAFPVASTKYLSRARETSQATALGRMPD